MDILYITPYVPSQIRTRPYNLIRALAGLGHRVTLVTASGTSEEERVQITEMGEWTVQAEGFPVPLSRSLLNCLRALPTGAPLQSAYAHHPELEARLSELVAEGSFDVVHVEHLRAARLIETVNQAPVVYDSVDCISSLFQQTLRTAPQLRSRLMAWVDLGRTRRYEAHLLTQTDEVVVTSERDQFGLQELAAEHLPPDAQTATVTVVTNGVDLDYFRPFRSVQRDQETIVFTGKMSYHANIAAVLFFAGEILPLIWRKAPDVRFQVVGKDPDAAVQRLADDERIEVTGTVPDLRPYLAQATVSVCPAPYAVGIQNKVLEAMAMGTPVVSTSAGSASLDARDGEAILVTDNPEAMADAVLGLLDDPEMAERVGAGGRRYVETNHSWESSARRLTEVYERAIAAH